MTLARTKFFRPALPPAGPNGAGSAGDYISEGIDMKVLIVEDDFISRRLLQRYLSPYGECDIAVNGAEALLAFHLARQEGDPYDLICLDIMMPELDGHQTLKAIRRLEADEGDGGLRGVKIIMTTMQDDPDSILEAFNQQCEAYLLKPIDRERLFDHLVKLGLLPEGPATSRRPGPPEHQECTGEK
jgi:two-component system, chemotaxis family, chemotaxis protein CheY